MMLEEPSVPWDENSVATLDRRSFIRISGGIVVLFSIGDSLLFAQEPARMTRPALPTDFNAFLRIGANGRVSCYTGKIEMGQGVVTSLGQMIAEELDVDPSSVDMVMGDTELCPWDMGTFGSGSTRFFGPALRAAGAEARAVLVDLAAERLNIPRDQLVTADGIVFAKGDNGKRVSYAELAAGGRIERHVTGKVPLKKPAEFKVIGKSRTRADGRDKVTGRAKYTADIQIPGMLYARIVRPPVHGAKLTEVDDSGARAMEGVQVVRKGDFIAVLHASPDVAAEALGRIKAKFDLPRPTVDDETIFDHFLKSSPTGQSLAKNGDLGAGERDSVSIVESKFLNDYVAHAPMEPHAAVAQFDGKKATVWASTQTPFRAKEEVARELGISSDNVHIITPYLGGGFGGKSRNLQLAEAARIAAMCGKPVQVAWTREEEFFFDSFRPAAVVNIRSGMTAAGTIGMWDYHVYCAGERGAVAPYEIPNMETVAYGSVFAGSGDIHPFATGPWRAPANNTNTFARESQLDILAAKIGVDPVEFRLRHLRDQKMINVLKTAREKFEWKPAKGPSGRGFGVACGTDAGAYVATMAEVSVDRNSGEVKVKRVVTAQDMGLVVNPEGATLQVEGCVMMGLGYALTEGIHFRGGDILDRNFNTYDIPRFSWLPKIDTVLIGDREADPQGGGEPAIITMGAVVANAIFDAVDTRLYRLPMTRERVLDALKKG